MNNGNAELVVIEGPQAGARQSMAFAHRQRIGGKIDCDICFSDASGMEHELEIVVDNSDCSLTLIDGKAVVNDTELVVGRSISVSHYTPVRIGETSFMIVNENAKASIDLAGRSATDVEAVDRDSRNRVGAALIVFLVGSGLIAAGAAALTMDVDAGVTGQEIPLVTTRTLKHLIEQAGFLNVRLTEESSGKFVVEGIVETRKDQQILEELLQRREEQIAVNTAIGYEINEAVRAVYRMNDLLAEVVPVGPGQVVVETDTADVELLNRIEAAVQVDVPDLISLERRNTVPTVVQELPAVAEPVDVEGKRVMLVVSGDPAYVLTEDQSRYFIGSMLPTGHTIASIDDNVVILNKDGISSELVF